MWHNIKDEYQKWGAITPTNALYDRSIIWLFFILLAIGFTMVTSASIAEGTRLHNSPFYYAIRDGVYLLIALIVCVGIVQVPSERWEQYHAILLLLSVGLLIITLIFGKSVNGATRWIPIGPINFQSSEIAKLVLICYFSSFYKRKFDEMRERKWAFLRPISIFCIFALLLYIQPDLGSIMVLFSLTVAMFLFMGAKLFIFITLSIVMLLFVFLSIITSEYRIRRVTSFSDPFADMYGDGYQLANAQMAFGQGEWFGKGLGNSVQKLGYLPEAHTDFITAIIGEEFGFIGLVILIGLLAMLIFKALKISRESMLLEVRFRGFFSFGIGIWFAVQGFINVGAASGLIPTKGLTFPFVSYGGSSLIMMAVAVGILLRIDHENRLIRVGHAHLNQTGQ